MNDHRPIACDLSAIEDENLEQHKRHSTKVINSVKEFRELSDGYAFRIPSNTESITHAGAFISRERKCCPFFKFTLEVSENRGPVWLKMTGDSQVKTYIKKNIIDHLQSR